MGFDDDAIVVADKEYFVEWTGTKSTYDGTAKRATLKSSLFGAAGAAGELSNWILNWENGKPSSRSSSSYVYLCGTDEEIDEENCEIVVGYDAYGKKVDYLEILAWILGAEPGKEVEFFDGTKVTARSFAEVREFGVKDTSVKEVALLINTSGNKNVYAHGVVEGTFTIAAPGTDPAPSPMVMKIAVPDAYAGFVDNGDAQTGVEEGAGYVLSGDWKAADPGIYTAVVTLAAGYAWADGSTDAKQIEWSLAQAAGELVCNGKMLTGVAADAGYEIEGTDKAVNASSYEARITLKDGYRWSDGDEASCKVVKWSIDKVKNPVKVKTKVRKIACKKLAKGKLTVRPIIIKNLAKQTKATFKKVKKGSARQAYKALKINKKTVKVTVRKGAKKGVCKLEVKVHVAATANYKAFSKVVRVKVRVK